MTTIAYHHGTKKIAVDGRSITRGIISSDNFIKYHTHKNETYFYAGCVSDFPRLLEVKDGTSKDFKDIDITCLRVSDSKVYDCGIDEETGYWEVEVNNNFAIGSGMMFAIAGMDMNLSAEHAVKYTMTRDPNTGGKITLFDVNKMEFIDVD